MSESFASAVGVELERWRPDLPAGARDLLARHCALLAEAGERLNLTGIRDPAGMALKHVVDSLLALPAVDGDGPLMDLGTGGGMPGIPLAAALPARPVLLVESRRRKAAALAEIVAALGLGPRVEVVHARGEELLAERPVDVVVTRAVGSVVDQLQRLAPVRGRFRRLVMMKGPGARDELRDASRIARLGFAAPETMTASLPDGAGERILLVFDTEASGAGDRI